MVPVRLHEPDGSGRPWTGHRPDVHPRRAPYRHRGSRGTPAEGGRLTVMDLVTLRDVQAAAVRIAGIAIRTPLLGFGEDFWLKPENLQPIGAFKIRGAANAIAALSPSAVITHSSGNHGRALAYAAARRKIPVTVVMPDTSPKV